MNRNEIVRKVFSRIDWKTESVKVSDRLEFVNLLGAEGVPVPATSRPSGLYRDVARLAADHKRLQEIACNLPVSEDEQRALDAYETEVQDAITGLFAPYRITPVFSGDPRGATVKLRVPSGKTNDWGREGICVPWS